MLDLDLAWFLKLYHRIPAIEARRLLPWLQVVAYPHVEEEVRRHIFEGLMRTSGYERLRQEALAAEGFARGWGMLRGMGTRKPTDGEERKD